MRLTRQSFAIDALLTAALFSSACSSGTSTPDSSTGTDVTTVDDRTSIVDVAPDREAAAPVDTSVLDVPASPDVVSDTPDAGTPMDVTPPVDATPDVTAPADVVQPPDVVVPHDGAGDHCDSTQDCQDGLICAWAVNDCSAAGVCVARPTPSGCGAVVLLTACGCDESDVHWTGGCRPDLPQGYGPAPTSHSGTCGD